MTQIPFAHLGPDEKGDFEYRWSDSYLQAHFISDVGKKREHNEDSCILCLPDDEQVRRERGFLFAVADGMGGASAGEFASNLALTTIVEELYLGPVDSIPNRLRESIEQANARIFNKAETDPEFHGMGTTASALMVLGDCAYVGQVGDSRVYLLRSKGTLVQITDDHSLVAEQVRSGLISEEEARNHSLKNLVTRAVGIKEEVEVDLFSFRLKKGDTILICSDGLNNMVSDRDVGDGLRIDSIESAARLLVGKALEEGGTDNISVGLVRVTDTPPRTEMQPGCQSVRLPSGGLLGVLRRLFT